MQYLLSEIKNKTGLITLKRPQALNALNLDMIRGLSAQFQQWAQDPNISQVMISSSTDQAFCAGGDLKALYYLYLDNHQNLTKITPLIYRYFQEEYALNSQIKHFPKPYLALLNGYAMGGGLGISLHGSLKIAANNLILAMPETSIGYFTDAGSTYFLSRCAGELGAYIALTSVRLNAAEASYAGLIDQIIGTPPIENHLKKYQTDINACFQYNSIPEIFKALQQHASSWAQHTYDILLKKSPLSLRMTLKILREAKTKNFDACMKSELDLALYFIEHSDFFEGIRAAVIDKDHAPQWQYK